MNATVLLRTTTVAAMMACFAIHAGERMKIVVTSFPLYDWTRQVIGETPNRFDLEFLQKNGTDLHSYQPTSIDLVKVAQCDLFVCIGGESDETTTGLPTSPHFQVVPRKARPVSESKIFVVCLPVPYSNRVDS